MGIFQLKCPTSDLSEFQSITSHSHVAMMKREQFVSVFVSNKNNIKCCRSQTANEKQNCSSGLYSLEAGLAAILEMFAGRMFDFECRSKHQEVGDIQILNGLEHNIISFPSHCDENWPRFVLSVTCPESLLLHKTTISTNSWLCSPTDFLSSP